MEAQLPTAARNYVRTGMAGSMGQETLDLVDRWWRAANYLSVGQIYLRSTRCCGSPFLRTTPNPGSWATGAPLPG